MTFDQAACILTHIWKHFEVCVHTVFVRHKEYGEEYGEKATDSSI